MIIKFSDISSNLGTRELGAKVREDILVAINNSEKVTFDLSGVEVVSSSFADECFGKLLFSFELIKLKESTTFKGGNDFVIKIITNCLKSRFAESKNLIPQ